MRAFGNSSNWQIMVHSERNLNESDSQEDCLGNIFTLNWASIRLNSQEEYTVSTIHAKLETTKEFPNALIMDYALLFITSKTS